MVNKYMRISDDAHKRLSYYRDIMGKDNVSDIINGIDLPVVIDDVRAGLEYVKGHKINDSIVGRCRNILSWLNLELGKDVIDLEYKGELLKLKIFCEEYLK